MSKKMKIAYYRDLKDRDDLFHLWSQSFGWLAAPSMIDEWADTDLRLKGTPVGVCGIVGGKMAGFVGVLEIPTRDKRGNVELIGGIWAIATRPSVARSGVGKQLLDVAEDYFRERGIRLSMLTTSRAIVAHRWYSKVGYVEVETVNKYPHFYKVFHKPAVSKEKSKPKSKADRAQFDKVQAVTNFARFMQDRCGFVYRDLGHFSYLRDVGALDTKISVCTDKGHVIAGINLGSAGIREIIASSQKSALEMIKSVEDKAQRGAYYRYIFDPNVVAALKRAGYREDVGTYDVLMCKPLGRVKFSDVYDRTFTISRSDFF